MQGFLADGSGLTCYNTRMADIVLFGATGYTGRLTAAELARRGVSFAIAGRDRTKLERLAADVGDPEIHIAEVGDVDALVSALTGAKVLITTVGPFATLGETAVEAALRAGVHYVDSTGEGTFIDELAERFDERARTAGVVLAPAMGFDEVPGDVVSTIAAAGLEEPELTVTYAMGLQGSAGTVRSALGIIGTRGPWLEDGRHERVAAGEKRRWAPLPPPLGPSDTWSFPLALGRLAPRHLELRSFRTFVRTTSLQGKAMRFGAPALRLLSRRPFSAALDAAYRFLPEGPSEEDRSAGKWTILAEATGGNRRRNVVARGTDAYGFTARSLVAAGMKMCEEGYEGSGLRSPAEAVDIETWREMFDEHGIEIEVYAED